MTTTILTDEQIDKFARAIEQAVLQSPEIQAWKKDAERLEWLAGDGCQIQFWVLPGNIIKYRLFWPDSEEWQSEWFESARDAIDAAMEKQP